MQMSMNGILIGLVLFLALVCILGGLWILARQKVVVDQNGQATSVEIPFFGKMTTNVPSLVAVVLGVALAFGVQQRIRIDPVVVQVPLNAELSRIAAAQPVFVAAIPQRYFQSFTPVVGAEKQKLTIRVEEPGPYNVIAYVLTGVSAEGVPSYKLVQGPARQVAEPQAYHFTRAFN